MVLVAVQVMFGTWPIVGKIALRDLPGTGLITLRLTGATFALFAAKSFFRHRPDRRRGDLARFALYSLLGVVLNQFLFTKGLAHSTVVNATLLSTSIPVFTLIVGALMGYERLSRWAAAGTLLAALGVIYLVNPWRAGLSGGMALGDFLLVANTFCYGAYIAISQDAFRRYGPLEAITIVFALGSLMAAPVGFYQLSQTRLESLGAGAWLAVAYIILVPTAGAYYLNAWALTRVAPSTVAVYIYLQPLVAFAVAPLVLGAQERWNARLGVATLLIFAGVAAVTWGARSRVVEEVSDRPEALGH